MVHYFCILLFKMIIGITESHVLCEDANALPWIPLGYSCPVNCATVITAVKRLKEREYHDLFSKQKLKFQQKSSFQIDIELYDYDYLNAINNDINYKLDVFKNKINLNDLHIGNVVQTLSNERDNEIKKIMNSMNQDIYNTQRERHKPNDRSYFKQNGIPAGNNFNYNGIYGNDNLNLNEIPGTNNNSDNNYNNKMTFGYNFNQNGIPGDDNFKKNVFSGNDNANNNIIDRKSNFNSNILRRQNDNSKNPPMAAYKEVYQVFFNDRAVSDLQTAYKTAVEMFNNGTCDEIKKGFHGVGRSKKCSGKTDAQQQFLKKFTAILNEYSPSGYQLTEGLTAIILEKVMGTKLDLRIDVFDVNKMARRLQRIMLFRKHHDDRPGEVVNLKSKYCMNTYVSGCFCKRGYVENAGQCVLPNNCFNVGDKYATYLSLIEVN